MPIADQNQLECINCLDKNLQIIACAGAGKTRTIVLRLLEILKSRLASEKEIVAITFTEKAAGEFKERIFSEYNTLFGNYNGLSDIQIGTIHSFCLNMLKEFNSEYKKYEVITDIQAKLLIKNEIDSNFFHDILVYAKSLKKTRNNQLTNYKWNDISTILNTLNIFREENIAISKIPREVNAFYEQYKRLLEEKKYFDYAEIQKVFYEELCNNQMFAQSVANNLKFIFIDEYQDVNTVQELILSQLHNLNPHLNICVVGDDDQMIYNWRGSSIDNFLNFQNRYSNSTIKYLDTNYRSSEAIVRLGESIVLNNVRYNKKLLSNKTYSYEKHDVIYKDSFKNISEENEFIISAIKKLVGSEIINDNGEKEVIGYNDIAIIVHSPSKLLEFNRNFFELMDANSIPYIIEGTKNLFDSPEIKDIITIFTFIYEKYCSQNSYSLELKDLNFEYFKPNDENYKALSKSFSDLNTKFINSNKKTFFGATTLQDIFLNILINLNSIEIDKDNESEKVLYNLAAFSNVINEYETIQFENKLKYRIVNFVNFLRFDANALYPEGWLSPSFSSYQSVRIISYHKSKGLEFPVVFLPYLCQDYLFPTKGPGGYNQWSILYQDAFKAIEKKYNEKEQSLSRLFYVGVTRSKKYLFMTKSLSYLKPGGKRALSKLPPPVSRAGNSSFVNYNHEDFLRRNLQYDFNNKNINEQKMALDFSTLMDIFECSHKFKLQAYLGFASPLNVRMGFGKSVHNILEVIHKTYKESGKIISDDYEIDKLMGDLFHLPYTKYLPELNKDMIKSAKVMIKNYVQASSKSFADIEFIEQTVDYKVDDLIFVNGRVDLVKNNKSGEVIIIDFKSNEDALSTKTKRKQLLIYALGYYKFTGIAPTAIHPYSLNVDNSAPTAITVRDLEEIEESIIDTYNTIKNKDFSKNWNPESARCRDCMFKGSCSKNLEKNKLI